ncbi:MAG: inositol 2-dehydrogenase [Tepidiforma sp.]|nr:MAG: inositol 2-dehydrogenase [Tepidiforma sp.]
MAVPVVGLIGCGHIGRFHSRNLRGAIRSGVVEARYAAVCDRDRSRAEAFAAITGAELVTDDAAELLAFPGLTAVYICTETAEHPALVEAAAERGLDIFCEKPLARTLGEVERMVEAVERAGVVHQVGLVLRYSPVLTVLAELMRDPGLGPLLTAHLRDDQFFPVRGHYRSTWRGSFERAGGGTLIEHSIHDVDVFRWLFGEVTAVRCHTREATPGHAGVEDVALVTFQHEGGHQTTLSSVWHGLDDRPSTRYLEVFFEGGYFATEHDFLGPIRVQGRSGPVREMSAEEVFERYVELAGLDGRGAELARAGMLEDVAFLQCAASRRAAFPDFGTALAAHRVVDACYRSAAEAREIALV